jgi:hypothetical protein
MDRRVAMHRSKELAARVRLLAGLILQADATAIGRGQTGDEAR